MFSCQTVIAPIFQLNHPFVVLFRSHINTNFLRPCTNPPPPPPPPRKNNHWTIPQSCHLLNFCSDPKHNNLKEHMRNIMLLLLHLWLTFYVGTLMNLESHSFHFLVIFLRWLWKVYTMFYLNFSLWALISCFWLFHEIAAFSHCSTSIRVTSSTLPISLQPFHCHF